MGSPDYPLSEPILIARSAHFILHFVRLLHYLCMTAMGSLLTPPGSPMLAATASWMPKMAVGSEYITSLYSSIRHIVIAPLQRSKLWISFKTERQPRRIRPTAWLDGLRGFAALLVYVLHHEVWAHESLGADKILENAFGYEGHYFFAQLPGVRILLGGGHFSVAIFFVISGYVLSLKPLSLIHDRHLDKLGDNIASALFRRWLRLYIPVAATTFLFMTCINVYPNLQTHLTPQTSYIDEIWKWYDEFKQFSFIFKMGDFPWMFYNDHAWTIPLEFKGSIVIYTTILAFSRCTRKARFWLGLILTYYFMYVVDGWYVSCFLAGMLLVDLDLLAESGQLPSFFRILEPYKDLIFYTLFILGLYFGGVPAHGLEIENLRNAWGWHYLSYLRPSAVYMPKSYFLFWGGVFLIASIPRIPWLKSFFELPTMQWIGKISFALYLIHGPVLWTIGDRVYAAIGWTRMDHATNIPNWSGILWLPKWGPMGLEFSFLCAQLVLLPVTLWVASLATRFFDSPAMTLASWIYGQVREKDEEEKHPV